MADEGLVLQEREMMRVPEMEYLHPVMDLETAKKRLLEFQQYVKFYLRENEDYGTIPGTAKPTLLKPGADKLCELYGLADTYPDSRIHRVEDWSKEPPLFDYEVACVLIHKGSGVVVGEGMGSCNSYESKYKWRDQNRKCPACGKECIIKGKEEYGGGWLCFAKKGGCGAKFTSNDQIEAIAKQTVGRIPNPDIADIKNTILKMAKKRSKIDATIAATRSSGIFTQDLEDIMAPEVANPLRNFTGVIKEMKAMEEAYGVRLKGIKPVLWIKNEGICAQLSKVKEESVTVECIERQGQKSKYWEVIRVLRIGEHDFSDANDLTSALQASVAHVQIPVDESLEFQDNRHMTPKEPF